MFFSAIQYRGQNKRPLRTLKIEYPTNKVRSPHCRQPMREKVFGKNTTASADRVCAKTTTAFS